MAGKRQERAGWSGTRAECRNWGAGLLPWNVISYGTSALGLDHDRGGIADLVGAWVFILIAVGDQIRGESLHGPRVAGGHIFREELDQVSRAFAIDADQLIAHLNRISCGRKQAAVDGIDHDFAIVDVNREAEM